MSKWSTALKNNPRLRTKRRVLIADDDTHFARRFAEFLWDHHYETKVVRTVSEAKDVVQFWRPDVIFCNLILPETNALSLVKFMQYRGFAKECRFIVMSKQALPQAVEQLRRVGVHSYLLKPFPLEDALDLASEQLADEITKTIAQTQTGTGTLVDEGTNPHMVRELHLINLMMKQAQAGNSSLRLFNLMRMINLKVRGLRCSLIHYVNDDTAMVMAANDDENLRGFVLRMRDYPEIQEVRRRLEPVVILNSHTDDLMRSVQDKVSQTPYATIVLFPVFRFNQFYGVLSLRMQQRDPADMFYIEKYGQVCSQIISMTIGSE